MPRGEEDLSDEEREDGADMKRKERVRPELAGLEDEEELTLDEPDRPHVKDDYEDDDDAWNSGVSSVSTYVVPILLAGPFYVFNVWRACHWICHRLISFPLDFVITPLETSRTARKTTNAIGWVLKRIIRFGGIPITLYIGWLICPGVLKPNLLNIYFPWVAPYTDMPYEGWIKKFYYEQARLPMGPGGSLLRTGTRAG